MENPIEIQIAEITSKVKKMTTRMKRLESENESLKKSVMTYLELLDQQKKETDKLTQQLKAGQIQQQVSGDNKKLQKELDKYIGLIDKCIAAVNSKL
ncbi:MAG TPA: hypothetical protein PLU10_05470 [Chitinophagaceae bacterium]|nr:hypothetical protein [Chitinophagaceae bacterium]